MIDAGRTDPAVVEKVLQLTTQAPPMPLKAQCTANVINGVSFLFTDPGFKVPIDRIYTGVSQRAVI
ncbi:hypothetical protein GL2_21430 [Microbulbifer sp. GL-2]|nr:hypothetical protein GL2_21430 [Microbulbifer sp. GL-2]